MLKTAVVEFYKLNWSKGKEYTIKNFKNGGIPMPTKDREALIRRIKIKQKEIDQDVVIKMFDKLKQKVHNANQNGLSSLLKI